MSGANGALPQRNFPAWAAQSDLGSLEQLRRSSRLETTYFVSERVLLGCFFVQEVIKNTVFYSDLAKTSAPRFSAIFRSVL